ncbi:PQQ-dependent sugar dehydrogenase [Flavobacterium sp.]|uniref:PQQ-dependent sugar dehydrogenase n=1 Tax=Flavobacterium sp. TaxID=239 RepID=UPI00286D19F3|nr:PQQ-dependent sugar dehydrogenase [Flavobacterium sp.]
MKQFFTFLIILLVQFSNGQTIGLTTFATGLSGLVAIEHPPGDDRLFVVQQSGAIRIVNPDGTLKPNNFLTLTTATISTGGERGLLGLAFHPNYATNGYFYVNYTNTAGNTVIARYSVSANPDVANTTGTILLTVTQPFSNHNGGTLRFGPDGYLYIGMGDGGSSGDPGNRAQNINENLGKMLRLDVDSASPYGIPADNPYAGAVAGNDEIWAIGLRNPWKFSFDMANGDLWIADVGQNQYEEINHVVAPAPGLNFGWKCYEGNNVYSTCTGTLTYTFPIAQYSHASGGCSITGGYVYRGTTYPNLVGKFIFADYCSNQIGYVNDVGTIVWTTAFSGVSITTFGQDINGEVYVGASGTGTIYKVKDTALSTTSYDKDKFEIYPNPADNELFLKTNGLQFPAMLTVVDTSGKTLINQTIGAETNDISIASLQSGLYIVSINDQSGLSISSKLSVR